MTDESVLVGIRVRMLNSLPRRTGACPNDAVHEPSRTADCRT